MGGRAARHAWVTAAALGPNPDPRPETLQAAIADYFVPKRPARVVDVGGAYGVFVGEIVAAIPGTRGLIFDQPQVIERARKVWAGDAALAPVAGRVGFAAGSFFDATTLPTFEDGDVLAMRLILHDWSDEAREAGGRGKAVEGRGESGGARLPAPLHPHPDPTHEPLLIPAPCPP